MEGRTGAPGVIIGNGCLSGPPTIGSCGALLDVPFGFSAPFVGVPFGTVRWS